MQRYEKYKLKHLDWSSCDHFDMIDSINTVSVLSYGSSGIPTFKFQLIQYLYYRMGVLAFLRISTMKLN